MYSVYDANLVISFSWMDRCKVMIGYPSFSHKSVHHSMVTRSPNHCKEGLGTFFSERQICLHLVSKFMSHNDCHIFLVAPRRLSLLLQDCHLPVGDQAPVLHGARAEVGDGNHVLLRQREGGVEVVLVVGEDLRPDL